VPRLSWRHALAAVFVAAAIFSAVQVVDARHDMNRIDSSFYANPHASW
jgi:xanthine/uracil/vitamin C permease (AzgA family)